MKCRCLENQRTPTKVQLGNLQAHLAYRLTLSDNNTGEKTKSKGKYCCSWGLSDMHTAFFPLSHFIISAFQTYYSCSSSFLCFGHTHTHAHSTSFFFFCVSHQSVVPLIALFTFSPAAYPELKKGSVFRCFFSPPFFFSYLNRFFSCLLLFHPPILFFFFLPKQISVLLDRIRSCQCFFLFPFQLL